MNTLATLPNSTLSIFDSFPGNNVETKLDVSLPCDMDRSDFSAIFRIFKLIDYYRRLDEFSFFSKRYTPKDGMIAQLRIVPNTALLFMGNHETLSLDNTIKALTIISFINNFIDEQIYWRNKQFERFISGEQNVKFSNIEINLNITKASLDEKNCFQILDLKAIINSKNN